jgi:pilus assembly protein TadC
MNLSISSLVEHYKLKDVNPDNKPIPMSEKDKKILLGMTFELFLTVLAISFILLIFAVVLLVQNWKNLPDWAKILGVLGVIPVVPLGPVLTIIVVLCGRKV